MKYKWLNHKHNKKIIVFFNGWGMDESVVCHLNPQDYDVIMFYDYNNLETDFSIPEEYSEKDLVAWSMGVMCASLFNIKYKSTTAVNGTLQPVNNRYGIPVKIYDMTVRGFTPEGAQKFIKNMFNSEQKLPVIKREFENTKKELEVLKSYNANLEFKYNRVIISSNDKIIPTKNQEAYWGMEANLESGHCPFYLFKNWSELL